MSATAIPATAEDADRHAPSGDGHDPHDKAGTVEPHAYWPSYQHMGDCAICGHVAESPLHVDPPRRRRDLLDV